MNSRFKMRRQQVILYITLICFTGIVTTATINDPKNVNIINYENEPNTGDGSYYFRYDLSDGTSRMEKGTLVKDQDNNEYLQVVGSYSYTDPDGKIHSVNYNADENGYTEEEMLEGTSLRLLPSAALASLVGGGLG